MHCSHAQHHHKRTRQVLWCWNRWLKKLQGWRFNGSRHKLFSGQEHRLWSAAISGKLLWIRRAATPFHAAFSLGKVVLCESAFYIFLSLWTGKKHTSKQRRILMVELWMHRVDMPPAGHGPTLFTQLLMDNRPKLWLWPAAWSKFEKDDKDPHSNGNKQHVPQHHT